MEQIFTSRLNLEKLSHQVYQQYIIIAQIKTVKKKGMPCYKDAMSEGDLHIKFEVEFPLPGQLKNEQIE